MTRLERTKCDLLAMFSGMHRPTMVTGELTITPFSIFLVKTVRCPAIHKRNYLYFNSQNIQTLDGRLPRLGSSSVYEGQSSKFDW